MVEDLLEEGFALPGSRKAMLSAPGGGPGGIRGAPRRPPPTNRGTLAQAPIEQKTPQQKVVSRVHLFYSHPLGKARGLFSQPSGGNGFPTHAFESPPPILLLNFGKGNVFPLKCSGWNTKNNEWRILLNTYGVCAIHGAARPPPVSQWFFLLHCDAKCNFPSFSKNVFVLLTCLKWH